MLRPNNLLRMGLSWAWSKITFAKTARIDATEVHLYHPSLSPKMRFNLRAGHYEAHEQVVLKKILSPDDRMVEVGGGIGFLSLVASKTLPPGNILTVEANPQLVDLITKTRN